MGRRAAVAVSGAAALLVGCGGGSTEQERPAPPAPAAQLPFPPQAGEPLAGPPVRGTPRGRIVRVGGRPEGVAVLDGVAAVGVKGREGRDELVLLDVASGRVQRRVRISGAPRHVSTGGGRFLVPAEATDDLVLVTPDGDVETVRVGDNPHDATWAGGVAYTADEFGSTVTEVRGGRRGRTFPVDVQPGGVVAVGDQLAVISVRAYTVELFDRRTLRGGGSQNVGYGPSHAVATRDGRLWVADTRGGAISVFETRPRLRFVARVSVPGSPYGLALDEERGRLWVTRTGRNAVSALATRGRPRVTTTVPTARQPNTVAVDPATGRLVLASATDGTVQLLDP